MTDLHGNEPLVFDYDTADRLAGAARRAADAIRDQTGTRRTAVHRAEQDFEGHYARLFSDNAETAAGDAKQLVAALDGLATITDGLITKARAEDARRKTARDWYEEREHRNLLEKGLDLISGEERPHDPERAPEPQIAPIPPNGVRHHGGHGGGGGTSSARPEHLRAFARTSSTANNAVRHHHPTVSGLVTTFNANTKWGSIDASQLMAAFGKWLDANDNDVRWARTIAAAFDEAGASGGLVTLSNAGLRAALSTAGVRAERHDLKITMPETRGFVETTGYALDPVNTATGNFIEPESDLAFVGAAAVSLDRMYNSLSTEMGAFGYGWSCLADCAVQLTDEHAAFSLPDGRVVLFPRLGEGWDRGVGENLWLARTPDDGYRISGNDGSWWSCGADGRLRSYRDGSGARITLTYDRQQLVEISHQRGPRISLTWADDRVVAAETSDGRTASYSYDEQGHLLNVTTAAGTRTYRWDTDQHLITAVIDPDGVVETENVYDESRRVRAQLTPHGRKVRFSYLPSRVTVVDDENGANSNTWIADARGRLVAVVDSDDKRQSMAYDPHGNQLMLTERDGSTTVHEYDDRGRRVRTVTPGGLDLQFTHDDADRITSVVGTQEAGPDVVTLYEYAGADREPASITDPEGGVTHFERVDGLLVRAVGPTGVAVRFGHDAEGNLTSVTDADGNTARLEYDATGRLVASVTPLGYRTSYDYDHAGHLIARTDPDGAMWRYEYSAGGRCTAVVDPTGGRTTYEHDGSGERSRIIDPLGRQTHCHYDLFGNRERVTLPDGSQWGYDFDSLSRLRTIESPDGGRWSMEYDATGELSHLTDPAGVEVSAHELAGGGATVSDGLAEIGVHTDAFGRPGHTFGPDGGETVLSYDRCGRVVEMVNAEGGLTKLDYDAAGRLVRTISPMGAATTMEWDACGRLVAAIDPMGARTTYEYDADRRLIRSGLPTGEIASFDYDECGRLVRRSIPGSGTTRFTYDLAGRVTEIVDAREGRRRFRYDAAGQLVEAIAANGGVTRYEYDELGRAVTITDPLGGVTRREFDALDRCIAETDPLGRTTRAGYDLAGRQAWQQDPSGRRTEWLRDGSGRVASVVVDGVVQSENQRDIRGRRLRIIDHTGPDGGSVTHELEWNGRLQLVSRRRGAQTTTWTYDSDGRRTAMTDPDGHTTTYSHDAAGRLTAVDHPLLGRATIEWDPAGRLTAARAGALLQSWEYRDGRGVAHVRTDADGSARTVVERDADSRVTGVRAEEEASTFEYDEACQLVAARFGDRVASWRYDACGRLIAESIDGERIEHSYDSAGQLLTTERAGQITRYAYDAAGRRIESAGPAARTRYEWSPTGWLSAVTTDHDRTEVHVDALGELVSVAGLDVMHDTAAWGRPVVQLGSTPILPVGPVTGIGTDWATPGWRPHRGAAADPWSVAQAGGVGAELPGVVGIGGAGEITIAGLEWMGARVYDPSTRGFLSVDSLDPVTGAAWSGNPYSYAGNDPLNALDPLGLRPATDEDLAKWDRLHNGAWDEAIAIGMVAGGALLMTAGPLGVIAGSAIMSAGVDAYSQVRSGEKFNVGELAVAAGIGAMTGGAGVGSGAMLAAGQIGKGGALAITMGTGGLANSGQYALTQLARGEHINWKYTAVSGLTGTAGGPLGEIAGTAGRTLAARTGVPALENLTAHGVNLAGNTTLDMTNDAVQKGHVDPIKSFLVGGSSTYAGARSANTGAELMGPEPVRPDPSFNSYGPYNDYSQHYSEQQAISRVADERVAQQVGAH